MPPTVSVAPSTDGDDSRLSARRARYDALAVVRSESLLRSKSLGEDGKPMPGRVQLCRRAVADGAGGVEIRVSGYGPDARAGVAGLQTCGSVWVCPVCSEKINAGRQAELDAGLTAWLANPGVWGQQRSALFLTATMRHHAGMRLADMWDAISPAWNRMTSGAGIAWNGSKSRKGGYEGDKARFGIVGYVRLVEVKRGVNGWHPHVHAILFLDAVLTPEQVGDLRGRMFGRWERALARGGYSVLEGVGLDLRPVTSSNGLADYFAKNTYGVEPSRAAYEVTGSHSKRLGKGGETPFQFLSRMVETGDADALDWWHEWEQASQGRRQLTWSRGMRDLLALGVEKSDEELAEEELDGESLVSLTREEWVDGKLWTRLPDLLDAAERGTLPDLLTWVHPSRFADAARTRGRLRPERRPRLASSAA